METKNASPNEPIETGTLSDIQKGCDLSDLLTVVDQWPTENVVINRPWSEPGSWRNEPNDAVNSLLIVKHTLDTLSAALIAIGCDFEGDIITASSFDASWSKYSDIVSVGLDIDRDIIEKHNIRAYQSSKDYYESEWRSHTVYNALLEQIDAVKHWNETSSHFPEAVTLVHRYISCGSPLDTSQMLFSHSMIVDSTLKPFLELSDSLKSRIRERLHARNARYYSETFRSKRSPLK